MSSSKAARYCTRGLCTTHKNKKIKKPEKTLLFLRPFKSAKSDLLAKNKEWRGTHRFGECSVVDGGETAEVSVPEDRLMIHLAGGQCFTHFSKHRQKTSFAEVGNLNA